MIGTDAEIDAFNQLFEYIFKGDKVSADFCFKLLDVAHTWDDLVDGGTVDQAAINRAFVSSFFEFQTYPLWYVAGLNFHVLNAFLKWRDANEIETDPLSTDNDLSKSYMLRAGLYDIFVIIAYHLYGDEWAKEIGPTVRKSYGETLADYINEMRL